jgi:hypothetical protein
MTKPADSGRMAEEIKQAVPSPEDRVRAIKEREQKATKGPWLVRRRHASADRCDGIEAHIGHTHPPEQSCWDVDECPGQEAEMIVQTDGGFYGPNADDADFIAHARADIPYLLSLVEELKGQGAAQEKEINRLTGMWAERADESEGWQSKFNAAEAEAEKAKARLVRVEAIIDDPDRKVEYGTPEYFLLQRIRAALTPEPATKAEVSHER